MLWFRMSYNPVHQPGLWAGSHGRADWRGSAGGGLVSDYVEQEDADADDDFDDDDDLVDVDYAADDDDDCN